MPTPQIVLPAHWLPFYNATGIPAAVWADDLLTVSGHTGDADGRYEPDTAAQLRQTFRNLTETLAEAGLEWHDVVEITSYHVGLQAQSGILLEIAGEFMRPPLPAWTAVGVVELFDAEAVVEVSCSAARAIAHH
ncbi:MAG: Rid family hydrolase [Pseudolysinimonas sp.]